MANGADPTIESHRGLRPSDYCTNKEILSILEEYAAKVNIAAYNLIPTIFFVKFKKITIAQ